MKMTKLEKNIYRLLWKKFNPMYVLKYNDEVFLGVVREIIKLAKNNE